MSVIGSNILAGASGQAGYNLTKSLRFRSSASASLSRTPASASNRTTWTWSGWVKRAEISDTERVFFSAGVDGNNFTALEWINSSLFLQNYTSGTQTITSTTAVFRDPSAWYHIVLAIDTTQATAANRAKIYVNGVQQAGFSGTPFSSSQQFWINFTYGHRIGARQLSSADAFSEQYMTEINFVDGQALTPSSFGETSSTTGVWIPKKYTGTYGTNGFYLPFTDTTSTSTLGTDFSGNSNTWTVNNISLTSGSTYDSMTDVPTLTSATAANYCVLNRLDPNISDLSVTISDGNLTASGSTYGATVYTASMQLPSSGKWYYEFSYSTLSTVAVVGIRSYTTGSTDVQYRSDGQKTVGGSTTAYGSSWTTGDVIGVAIDVGAGTITFYKNSVSQGAISIPTPTATFDFAWNYITYASTTFNVNFGQRPFVYTPPTGFVALNTFNLPTPTIGATASTTANKYMDVTLWTGNSGTQSITNSGSMPPDLVWIKNRTNANNHALFDSVRGATLRLYTDSTLDEQTEVNTLTAFNSNGFSLGSGAAVNSSNNYVGWQWRASGTTSNIAIGQYSVSPNVPSIASTVSANTTAGFSIVTYTGNGGTSDTIGHGLGVTPSMIIIKVRSNALRNWVVYHASLGSTRKIHLNLTDADEIENGSFGGLSPTSTTFGVGYAATNGSSETYVAYCFAPVAGYSAFGTYTGNGSTDGTFVYTGFRPRFVMVKSTSGPRNWAILDASRNPSNVANFDLYPNKNLAEITQSTLDFLSNGFKLRVTDSDFNAAETYIYMAFAENPFKYANAR